ncbi:MAG: DedA family protein [Myxococcales bacterium]|nr:DedA family protein [Myxococcales bacterium]
MDTLRIFIDLFLHLDVALRDGSNLLGPWLYVVLFAVVFCETGLVVMPFLPGDSLLFTCGAIASMPGAGLEVKLTIGTLIVAAILGDAVNYSIGRRIGERLIAKKPKWLNPQHLERTQRFYDKHGGKTIVFARFAPIFRTFAPFVAGVGRMQYRRFVGYNVGGAVVWVVSFVLAGYHFGNLPIIKRNFQFVVLAIIIVSVLPAVVEIVRARREARAGAAPSETPSGTAS